MRKEEDTGQRKVVEMKTLYIVHHPQHIFYVIISKLNRGDKHAFRGAVYIDRVGNASIKIIPAEGNPRSPDTEFIGKTTEAANLERIVDGWMQYGLLIDFDKSYAESVKEKFPELSREYEFEELHVPNR